MTVLTNSQIFPSPHVLYLPFKISKPTSTGCLQLLTLDQIRSMLLATQAVRPPPSPASAPTPSGAYGQSGDQLQHVTDGSPSLPSSSSSSSSLSSAHLMNYFHSLELVVISACHSSNAATVFASVGVQHVVCVNTQTTVLDAAAIEFTKCKLDAGFGTRQLGTDHTNFSVLKTGELDSRSGLKLHTTTKLRRDTFVSVTRNGKLHSLLQVAKSENCRMVRTLRGMMNEIVRRVITISNISTLPF